MPNWCSATMTVSGCTDEQVQRIVDAVERQQLLREFYPEPDWRQTPNEDGVLPGPMYKGQVCNYFPDGTADERWYYWRCSHWGTKWEISDPRVEVVDGVITIHFLSAWSPPSDKWFRKMSQAMPNAHILCTFSESGADFFGKTVVQDGLIMTTGGSMSSLKDGWVRRTLDPEKLAIYNDEDHENYDEVSEEVDEAWWDAEYEEVERVLALM